MPGYPTTTGCIWCIDDKYAIRLGLPRIESIVAALADGGPEDLSGVLFCRARRMLEGGLLEGSRNMLGGEVLLERAGYHQIWIHQFIRVKVLRHLFAAMPGALDPARSMDALKHRVSKPVTTACG
ncbi:MAG: hypothetical protein FGM40_01295 [Rhodocyclaceae bacterium]|nr:hypothetical protein [Rhodocyclaceae bacterium]